MRYRQRLGDAEMGGLFGGGWTERTAVVLVRLSWFRGGCIHFGIRSASDVLSNVFHHRTPVVRLLPKAWSNLKELRLKNKIGARAAEKS